MQNIYRKSRKRVQIPFKAIFRVSLVFIYFFLSLNPVQGNFQSFTCVHLFLSFTSFSSFVLCMVLKRCQHLPVACGTLKNCLGGPVSHKAFNSTARQRGCLSGVVVNTSALESRGRRFKSHSRQFVEFFIFFIYFYFFFILFFFNF